jgi:hypothetical protein
MRLNVSLLLFLCAIPACLAQTSARQNPSAPPKPAAAKGPLEDGSTASVDELKKQIADLKFQIDSLRELVSAMSIMVVDDSHRTDLVAPASAVFDPSSPNTYKNLATPAGSLLLSLGKVEPYLDGYKVELQIGNPLVATFRGFTVSATWAPRRVTYSGPDSDWTKQKRSKTFSFTQDLLSARWNIVELILPETKPDQFGQLEIVISTNNILMGTPLSR